MRLALPTFVVALVLSTFGNADAKDRPNILWITCEDIGPHLGCYGDEYATTPNLDRLAARGLTYLNAWSTAPVCAPARTAIISGMYPPSTGSQHMRSTTRLPEGMKMYPQYLREAGYYCTNNSKEDYNLEKPGKVWDVSSNKGHWKNRAPEQPFFAIFNYTMTHESQIRRRPHKQVHDPARVPLPAYHPDTPEVRQDWAQYHDKITDMDRTAASRLQELDDAGLTQDTIVFFYGDHGAGMPRGKRWPFSSGLRVPLIVHVPEKFRGLAPEEYKAGGKTRRPVGFVDLAPTLLSIVGIQPPAYMQGHAFMGEHEAPRQKYHFGFRGRMDERYDMVRTVGDERYIYVRHYMPHKIYGQHVNYMFQTPTTRVWKQLYDAGKLKPPQTFFWERKPPEELYDLDADPDEVKNLARSPEHQQILNRFRKAHREHVFRIRDVGFLPEGEIHARSKGSTPYEMGHDEKKYPLERIFAAAQLASSMKEGVLPELKGALEDSDSAVRYWGAQGILMREKDAAAASRKELKAALKDSSYYVRVMAGHALAEYGEKEDLDDALAVLLESADPRISGFSASTMALIAIDELGKKAASLVPALEKIPGRDPNAPRRMASYPGRILSKIQADNK